MLSKPFIRILAKYEVLSCEINNMAKAAKSTIGLYMRFFDFEGVENITNCCIVTFCVIEYKRAKARFKLEFVNNLNNCLPNILA
jgi:hypothetical protein